MKATKVETEMLPFDVRALRSLPGGRDLLPGVVETAAGVIAGHAIALLAEHPEARRGDVTVLGQVLWTRLRAVEYDRGQTVETAMAKAILPGFAFELERVLTVLVAAGGVRETLRAQRDAIDAQLAHLEHGGAQ